MKKILLILAAAATTLAASSQTKELDNLAKRLQKSDEAIADPKKSASANTWLDHTSALIAASKVYTKTLVADFPIEQTLALVGDQPNEIVEVTVMDQPHKKYVFDNFDIYVNQNGQVVFWQTKNEFRAGDRQRIPDRRRPPEPVQHQRDEQLQPRSEDPGSRKVRQSR